jgi:hypothetical protein
MALAVTASIKELRGWGLVWIILGPVLFLMASISKIESDLTFFLQLAVFSVVAVAAVVFGVAAVLGQAWSVTGLFALSALVAAFSFGGGVLMLAWPARVVLIWRIGMASLVAAWGIPLLYMALAIRSLVREERRNGDRRAGRNGAAVLGRDA